MAIGWDVFCWIGHRRCSRHMAIPLIRSELLDDYGIQLSDDAIDQYIRRYQVMLAARQQDPESLRRHYESAAEIILAIDGLQPEKGHEALYVVRELTRKRIWFAEPLLSATEDEVRGLRTIEHAILRRQKSATRDDHRPRAPEATGPATATAEPSPAVVDPTGSVVLDYCAAVRGILNDDQGGPLHPPGVRMAEALTEVEASIGRNPGAPKGGSR